MVVFLTDGSVGGGSSSCVPVLWCQAVTRHILLLISRETLLGWTGGGNVRGDTIRDIIVIITNT